MAMIKPLIAMGAMVGSLILVHEAGHFLVARMFGVSVKVFSLGVGQRLFGFKWGKTDFRVSALPIGGYVRWVGADPFSDGGADDDEDWIDAKGSFIHKPAWQRLRALLDPDLPVHMRRAKREVVAAHAFDHRLADEESLSVMLWVCNPLASGEKLSWLDDEQQSAAASSSNDKSTSQEDASYICDA